MHSDRRKGRGTRILYWHRTPPGVKVGRAALDEDAIRLLEQHNPDVDFDWTRILKGQPEEPREPRPARQPQSSETRTIAPQSGTRPQAVLEPAVSEPPGERPMSPAEAKLGSEGLGRLRGRHAEMLARITERVTDPERQSELKAVAERLNPDAWVTESDVAAGLDEYERTFESLRTVVGHRRRRGRRHARQNGAEPEANARAADQQEPE